MQAVLWTDIVWVGRCIILCELTVGLKKIPAVSLKKYREIWCVQGIVPNYVFSFKRKKIHFIYWKNVEKYNFAITVRLLDGCPLSENSYSGRRIISQLNCWTLQVPCWGSSPRQVMQNDNFSVISQRVVKSTLLDSRKRVPCVSNSWHRRFYFSTNSFKNFSFMLKYIIFNPILLFPHSSTSYYCLKKTTISSLHVFMIC